MFHGHNFHYFSSKLFPDETADCEARHNVRPSICKQLVLTRVQTVSYVPCSLNRNDKLNSLTGQWGKLQTLCSELWVT
jgi:hypothetical protein